MRSYDDIEAALFARNNDDPPHYHKNDPINGKKPKYTAKDPNPPPKYRQKDPNVPNREKLERNGGSSRGHGNGRRDLSDVYSRNNEDPPHYHKNDPINGKKPKYTAKDPNPPPKYRQKDPNVPNREKLERNGGSSRGHGNGRRELDVLDELFAREFDEDLYAREFEDSLWAREDLEDLWAREVEEVFARNNEDPPHYHKNDPINGKKPKYTAKDPNPPPKYRQKDPNVPNREKLERNGGSSRGHGNGRRELSFWY